MLIFADVIHNSQAMTKESQQKRLLKQELRSRFVEYLNSKGLRHTAGRFNILDKCLDQRTVFSIQRLYDDVRADTPVSLASVYQTVDLLCDCNILRKHYLRDNEASYEMAGKVYLHLICLNCGSIEVQEICDSEDSENRRVKGHLSGGKYRHFVPTFVSTSVYGRCAACRSTTE